MANPSQAESTDVVRRGRPPGEITPEGLIRSELIAHLKLYRKTREIVEKRLEDPKIDVEDLTKYMELLRKGIVEMAKPVLPNARPEAVRVAEPEEDGETILRRLIEGEKSR